MQGGVAAISCRYDGEADRYLANVPAGWCCSWAFGGALNHDYTVVREVDICQWKLFLKPGRVVFSDEVEKSLIPPCDDLDI